LNELVVVAAVIVGSRGILACRRSVTKAAGGKWEFPGGKVNSGEAPKDALIRELREELNIKVQVGDLISRNSTRVGDEIIDLSCYWTTVVGADPVSSTDHDRLKWIPVVELSHFDWAEPDKPAVVTIVHNS
jgi:8-oxo-dGTP diphosphatase